MVCELCKNKENKNPCSVCVCKDYKPEYSTFTSKETGKCFVCGHTKEEHICECSLKHKVEETEPKGQEKLKVEEEKLVVR